MKAMAKVIGALLGFIVVAAVAAGIAIGAVHLLTNPSARVTEVLSVVDPTPTQEVAAVAQTLAPSAACVARTQPKDADGNELPRIGAHWSQFDYEYPECLTADDAQAYVETIFAREEVIDWPQYEADLRTEQFATCAWILDWLNAETVGDAGRMDTASSWLGDAQNQVATKAHDTGGQVNLLNRTATAAASGDRAIVEEAKARTCDPTMGLHLQY